jgi:hypothetical protein
VGQRVTVAERLQIGIDLNRSLGCFRFLAVAA